MDDGYLIYAPYSGYAAKDSFSFFMNDGELDSTNAEGKITINSDIFLPMISR